MALTGKASLPVIKRLPKYYRYLSAMAAEGREKISSSELARLMGTTASQVRQDFNCFGGFGQQGIGYQVTVLQAQLGRLLLGDGSLLPTVLFGAGRLGTAVSSFLVHGANGCRLVGVFDIDPALVGREIAGVAIRPLEELADFCAQYAPAIAVLCVPRQSAAELAGQLPALGIRGVWNFSHYDLKVSCPGLTVENVHLGDSLMSLGYRLRNPD